MSTSFLAYWRPETVDRNIKTGMPARHVASDQFRGWKRGDVVWITTVRSGELLLVGRIKVGLVTTRAGAAKKLGEPTQSIWDAKHHIIAMRGSEEPLREISLNSLASKVRFKSTTSPELKVVSGRVNPQQLQTMRIVTPAGAAILEKAWRMSASAGVDVANRRDHAANRLWMYQINIKEHFDKAERFATTTENLFSYELPLGRLDWPVKQHAAHVAQGDVVLIRSSDKNESGVVALARVAGAKVKVGNNRVIMHPDMAASGCLRKNPIPLKWISALANPDKSTKRNLVDLEHCRADVLEQLLKRKVAPFGDERRSVGDDFVSHSAENDLPDDFESVLDAEGTAVWRLNLQRERSPVNRRRVLKTRPRPWACEACDFEFGATFGAEYADYIQVHHQKPLGIGDRTPDLSDFNLLCANCHVIAHRKNPLSPLSVADLRALQAQPPRTVVTVETQTMASSTVPVDTSGSGTALFVFESAHAHGKSNLESVLRAIRNVGDFPGQLALLSGDLLKEVPQAASHLLLKSTSPKWLVGLTGDHGTLRRTLNAWKRCAPESAQSAGFAACSPDALDLVPRAALAKGELFINRHDLDEKLFELLGVPPIQVDTNLFSMAWAAGTEDRIAALKEIGTLGIE